MTQPQFAPIAQADEVRPALQLHVPEAWSPDRPAEQQLPARTPKAGFGTPGPDQGYALRLARHFQDRLQLGGGEELEDVLVGAAVIACRRSGFFGRAPSAHDLRFAYNLWGFLDSAPTELVADRTAVFRSVSHDYVLQRELVDRVPESLLSATPEQVGKALGAWRHTAAATVPIAPAQAETVPAAPSA